MHCFIWLRGFVSFGSLHVLLIL